MFKRLILSIVIISASLLPAAPALAVNVFAAPCTGNSEAAVCKSTGDDPLTTKTGVLHRVTSLVAVVAGIAAVIVIVVAGIVYITSGGDGEKVAKAKRAIIFAAIGLLVIILSQTVIAFVIKGVT